MYCCCTGGAKCCTLSNMSDTFEDDLRCDIYSPYFLCENKLNTTEGGAAEVMFERVTEITLSDNFRSAYYIETACRLHRKVFSQDHSVKTRRTGRILA